MGDREFFIWETKLKSVLSNEEINFENCYFQNIDFLGFVFYFPVNFDHSIFEGLSDFDGAIFYRNAEFKKCIFQNKIECRKAIFCDWVNFKEVKFSQETHFEKTKFLNWADFRYSTFHSITSFHKSVFEGNAFFEGCKFFPYKISAEEKRYRVDLPFNDTPNFIGVKFKAHADFRNVQFSKTPHFEGAECDSIFFEGSIFEEDLNQEIIHITASGWAALIRLMERVHNLQQRQIFHEKLLEVEKEFDTEKGARSLYFCYQMMGSGRYTSLPLIWLCALFVFMTVLYWCAGMVLKHAVSFSMANTLPFIAYNRNNVDIFLNVLGQDTFLRSGMMLVGSVHTVASLVLIFLIGLALRNRFRVK